MRDLLTILCLVLIFCISASAATITVTNTNDSGAGSLRQAIADATPGSTINFDPSVFATPQTITLTSGTLIIDKNLTIQGPGANFLSISGNNVSGRFYINSGVTTTLDGITIRDAFVYNSSGGGISNGGTLTVSNSTISGNSVYDCSDAGCSSVGGGIFNIGTLTVINSTISGNTADFGGGIYNSGTLTVSNSTISGNDDSYGAGGGIANSTYYHPDSTVTITNSTISGNRGGIHSIVDGTETLINTIVAGNTGGDIEGTIETASHTLIGDSASSGGIVNGVNGNMVGVNPLLGPLQNNGGPTLTHALLTSSPAINAGNNCVLTENGCGDGNPALPFDQRGFGRVGVVDIGAFEMQGAPPPSESAYLFSANSSSFSVKGGIGGFNLTTNAECGWTANSNVGWITINSGTGTGDGSVTFTVLANSDKGPRSGTINVGSQVFTVTQDAPASRKRGR